MMDYQTYLCAKIREVFSSLEDIEERLDSAPEAFLLPTVGSGTLAQPRDSGGESRLEGLAGPALAPVDRMDLGRVIDEQRMQLLRAGRRGLTKIRQAGDASPSFTEEEAAGLEAIILLEGRPAILIQNGRFVEPPAEWAILEQYRDSIERVLPGVGRIEVDGHPRLDWVGTGFLVAPDVIMTNRHVAVEFCERRRGEGWKFISGIMTRIDFREEYLGTGSVEFACVEVIGIHGQIDLALLRVDLRAYSGTPTPKPLTMRYRSPRGMKDRKVYVVGYPAWDGRRNDPEPMRSIFSDIYNVKRLQPGTIRTRFLLGNTFGHDCSTLGGNSGSCVVDLESGQVLGLHFAGRYRHSNTAIALWKVRSYALLRRAGVQFG